MYQVIRLVGDSEPWWFFEGWKKDIVDSKEFDSFYEALKYYRSNVGTGIEEYEEFQSRSDYLATFWNRDDQVWCEECGDDIQRYHSLALLEDWQLVKSHEKRWAYSRKTGSTPAKFCSRPQN